MHAKQLKQIISALVLAAVVGLVAWGVTLLSHPVGSGAVATQTQPKAQSQPSEYTDSGQYWDVKIDYPAAPQNELSVIQAALQPDAADFKQTVEGFDPSTVPSLEEGGKLAFDAQYQAFTSPRFISYLYTIYEDTGGAHPNSYYQTFVFDQSGKPVVLGDLFARGSDYLGRLSQLATAQVTQQLNDRTGADASMSVFSDGLAPTADNYQNFTIDGDTLHIYFPPYQVAAYAAGSFDVSIPLSQLKDILAPGVQA